MCMKAPSHKCIWKWAGNGWAVWQSLVLFAMTRDLNRQTGEMMRLGLAHMGPKSHSCQQVPIWTQRPSFELEENIKYMVYMNINVKSWLFYVEKFSGFVFRVGSSFLLDPTLLTRVPSLTLQSSQLSK